MAKTYQSVIDKAELILQDESNDRWDEADHMIAAQEGENEMVKDKPDINPVISTNLLTAGSQQSLPSDAIQLMDVLCNMGLTPGTTRGDVVSVVDRKIMNAFNPGWLSDTASATVTHVIYDVKRAPKYYWVYPQSTGTNYLEIMTSDLFANSAKVIANDIMIPEHYDVALMHYILARAFTIDNEQPANAERAQAHYSLYLSALMGRDSLENRMHPKRTRESS